MGEPGGEIGRQGDLAFATQRGPTGEVPEPRAASGPGLEGHRVKPVRPRQVYAASTRLLEGEKLRQQAVARRFVERFRDLQTEPVRGLGWREWIERFSELTQWDLDLVAANETG